MNAAALIAFATAVVITTVGLAALAGYVVRPDRRERLLLWFGVFATLYGVRMFFKDPLVSSLTLDPRHAAWGDSTLNYVILIPSLLFAQELYGPGWRRAFEWITAGVSAYAVWAIVANIATATPYLVPEPSNAMFVAILVAVIAGARAGYRPPPFPEWRLLVAGIAVFLLFVVNEHAVENGLVPWRFSAEPLGFLFNVVALGYIAVSRYFSQDRRLAAIDQEMRSAREIQTAILPRSLPQTDGVEIAARYLPLAAVAGDFYDVAAVRDAVAVLVADVSGHGVPAALIASMVKVAFTSALSDTRDPGALLARMNSTLCGMFAASYVTAACVVVRPRARILEYALAGHPPPLLLRRAGGLLTLDERGIFLGFVPEASYATVTVPLDGDARLVIYTDGVTETPAPDGDLFGLERLAEQVLGQRDGTPAALADRVVRELRRFAGSRNGGSEDAASNTLPHDDVTLVVVDVAILDA